MMMMKERIFPGHPSLAHPPLHIASLALALLALASAKRELKRQNVS